MQVYALTGMHMRPLDTHYFRLAWPSVAFRADHPHLGVAGASLPHSPPRRAADRRGWFREAHHAQL